MPVATVLGAVNAAIISGSISSREELLHKVSPAVMKTIHENPLTMGNLAEVRSGGDSGRLAPSNRLFSLDESVQELASLKDVPGGDGGLVVEASAASEGRDPSGLAEISRRSGLSIVMAASVKEVCLNWVFRCVSLSTSHAEWSVLLFSNSNQPPQRREQGQGGQNVGDGRFSLTLPTSRGRKPDGQH